MKRTFIVLAAVCVAFPVLADVSALITSGREVFRRGESFDVLVRVTLPQAKADAVNAHHVPPTLEFWLEQVGDDGGGRRTRLGGDSRLGNIETFAATYRIDTAHLTAGRAALLVRLRVGGGDKPLAEARVPIEIATDVRSTDFVIHHISFPGWMLPGGNWAADMQAYGFNYSLYNGGDFWNRGAGIRLDGYRPAMQEMVRHGIDFLKYPTVYGWGLAHRPIGRGVSWCDPDAVEVSEQLTRYHAQAVREWPNCIGLNPMDEPDVSGYDEHLGRAFQAKTGMEPPAPGTKREDFFRQDPARYAAFEIFRNHVLQDFNVKMKAAMQDVLPHHEFTLQTFGDILTRSGLYPSTNTFQTLQCTHIYDHWPSSNNWMLFDVNFRRANRAAFWTMPLYVVTGCYGIMEDQWRAAWALGMSEKLDGHGYFTGAGELSEHAPWAEFSLAEMVRINRLNERYGNFFLSLKKRVEPLAVWYSLDNAARVGPAWEYEQEVVGAYFAVRRLHFPATLVVDEDLRAGLLKEHKVLLIAGAVDNISDDLRQAIVKFQAAGGKVVLDRTSELKLDKAVRMEADFREFAATMNTLGRVWSTDQQTSLQLRQDAFAEDGNFRQLAAVEAALAPLVARPVRANSHDVFVSVQTSGRAQYVFVTNDTNVTRHPTENERWITMQESVPARVCVTLPQARGQVVYDLFSGRRLAMDGDGVTLDMPMGGLAVLCLFPADVPAMELKLQAKNTWPGGVTMSVAPTGRAGNASGVVPAYVELRDPDGRVAWRKYVSAPLGRGSDRDGGAWTYPLGANDREGLWQASFTNLLTGQRADARLELKAAARGGATATIVSRLPSGLVFDELAFARLAKREGLVVVAGSSPESAVAAKTIADALKLDVVSPEDLRKDDVLPDALAPKPGLWMMSRPAPLNLTVGRDVILVGTPADNLLIKDLATSGMLRRQLDPAIFAPGLGIVQYVWSPFDNGKDAALVVAFDEAGLVEAAKQFLAAAQGNPLAKQQALAATIAVETFKPAVGSSDAAQAQASVLAVEQLAAKANAPTPATVLATVKLTDGARKMAAGGGLVAVGGNDHHLTVFDDDGKVLWKRDFSYRVIGVAVSPNGKYIAAAAFPRTYVYDRDGKLLFMLAEPQPSRNDVEGMILGEGDIRLITGDWQGKLAAYDGAGRRLWTVGHPDKNKKPTEESAGPTIDPDKPATPSETPLGGAIRAGCAVGENFALLASRPGKREKGEGENDSVLGGPVVLLNDKGIEIARANLDRAHVLVPVTGKGGDNNILAASWKKKIYLLDPANLEVKHEITTPGFVMDAAAVSTDGRGLKTIAATLFDGRVIVYEDILKRFDDGSEKITLHEWQSLQLPEGLIPTAIILSDDAKTAWVATWQGDVVKISLK